MRDGSKRGQMFAAVDRDLWWSRCGDDRVDTCTPYGYGRRRCRQWVGMGAYYCAAGPVTRSRMRAQLRHFYGLNYFVIAETAHLASVSTLDPYRVSLSGRITLAIPQHHPWWVWQC